MTIKAIDTQYRGYRFRSRMEARWAVFMDSLDLEWQYEPEGYQLPSGWYLPDFLVKKIGWIEIKPKAPTCDEDRLMIELCAATEGEGFIFYNGMWMPKDINNPDDDLPHAHYYNKNGTQPGYYWEACRVCGAITIESIFIERLCCLASQNKPTFSAEHPRILKAFKNALSARFEFGESGAPQSRWR